MNPQIVDLTSLRAKKARLASSMAKNWYNVLVVLCIIAVIAAVALFIINLAQIAWLSLALGLIVCMPVAWYRNELKELPRRGTSLTDMLSGEVLALFRPGMKLNPKLVWQTIGPNWQSVFILNHLWINGLLLEGLLSDREEDMAAVWTEAARLQSETDSQYIEAGHIIGAILRTSPLINDYLTHQSLSTSDVEMAVQWLGRLLDIVRAEKPYFGGIGRDWANGFTPNLNHFGHNISLDIEQSGGAHFGWLTTSSGVSALKSALTQGATSIALIGDPGIGKTSHVHALAQLLLAEKQDRHLEHRQIISLNPSMILSAARRPGDLEEIMLTLLSETVHAGHIMLFLDDANLFLQNGNGSFDLTQILLPVMQARSLQIIMAMTPHDYQQLKARSASFASMLTPVVLQEPTEESAMRILEDTALNLEHSHKVLITYEAIREAYRLSGRYMPDTAYPGKAIRLMESALSYADKGVVLKQSVQGAIEQTQGVKVSAAAPVEADMLLNLEDKIHERMINQKQAVHVVASALRRARAGVTNPSRPLGSYLFLGPTGVGKTELAKAIAAIYFNAVDNMIRLDMSEYQRPEDVSRLLSSGDAESDSLIMAVRRQPFSVLLLDEVEKAHPNILNLLLQLLDEGQLTDSNGRKVSFKDCIIIATSNAGAEFIRQKIEQQQEPKEFQPELTDELIHSGQFKPELLNRFDEIVVFRPLNQEELGQVVKLMLKDINATLGPQHITVELTDAAIAKVVSVGYDARLGARPMRRALQRMVEDSIAGRILRGEATAGDNITLDEPDLVTAAD